MMLQDVTAMQLSDRLKTDLVATVSHELKTPITSARMALYLLLEEQIGELNEEQRTLATTARDDLERQLAMIDHLLSFTRFESKSAPKSIRVSGYDSFCRKAYMAMDPSQNRPGSRWKPIFLLKIFRWKPIRTD